LRAAELISLVLSPKVVCVLKAKSRWEFNSFTIAINTHSSLNPLPLTVLPPPVLHFGSVIINLFKFLANNEYFLDLIRFWIRGRNSVVNQETSFIEGCSIQSEGEMASRMGSYDLFLNSKDSFLKHDSLDYMDGVKTILSLFSFSSSSSDFNF